MGPTLFVHLPRAVSAEDMEVIDRWLRGHASVLERKGIEWEFHFTPQSCISTLAVVPFGAESRGDGTATEPYLSEDEQLPYLAALDYLPTASLQLDNLCRSDREGHKMLSQLAAHLAREHGGVIEIGESARGSDIRSGKRFDMNAQGNIEDLLVDADFMEEWALHPDFHLPV